MKVKAIMTRVTQTIQAGATVEQAAQKLRDYNVGLLPVVDEHRMVGVVTDRDIVVRAVAQGRNPHLVAVDEVMTTNVVSCYEEQSITEAARLMQDNQVRRLVVLDSENRLAGVLTVTDLAHDPTKEKLTGHTLRKVTESA